MSGTRTPSTPCKEQCRRVDSVLSKPSPSPTTSNPSRSCGGPRTLESDLANPRLRSSRVPTRFVRFTTFTARVPPSLTMLSSKLLDLAGPSECGRSHPWNTLTKLLWSRTRWRTVPTIWMVASGGSKTLRPSPGGFGCISQPFSYLLNLRSFPSSCSIKTNLTINHLHDILLQPKFKASRHDDMNTDVCSFVVSIVSLFDTACWRYLPCYRGNGGGCKLT
mmetsp:Transcript_14317/g.33331  ORF Transcript_14317/g.33331 Transcript_14317/m.33331 type:complete len:220 (-) Transcript_14317:48-707(-)